MDTKTPMSNGAKAETVQSAPGAGVFDIETLFNGFWRWKWLVLLAAMAGATVGIQTIGKFVPTYRASMIVSPGNGRDSLSISSGAANLVGLGQSLGVVGQVSPTDISFERFKVLIGSIQLARILQEKHQLLQKIHINSWDADNRRWIKPKIPENSLSKRVRRFFHANEWREPGLESLASYLNGMVQIGKLAKSPFYEISVAHPDRDFANFILQIVHNEADLLINQQDRQGASARKLYLEERLEAAQLSEVRSVLLALLMKMEQETMMASTDPPYVLTIIEPLHVSAQPTEPAFLKIVGMPVAVAIAIAMALIAAVTAYQRE
jgi:hypothetical protein